MGGEHTTAVVQRYLDELAGDSPTEPIVLGLLHWAVRRLQLLCATLLHQSNPRLTRPPLNVQAAQLFGASAVTVKRRLSSGLRLLAEQLADLRPGEKPPDAI
jgi:hypothetical protein